MEKMKGRRGLTVGRLEVAGTTLGCAEARGDSDWSPRTGRRAPRQRRGSQASSALERSRTINLDGCGLLASSWQGKFVVSSSEEFRYEWNIEKVQRGT
jgi:hypothetical protein